MDFYENKTTEAIFSNSEWKVLLKQKPDVIERAKRENKIDMHDYFFELLKTVHTSKGKYSEMMILGGSIGIGRLVLDRYSYYIYTTDAGDKQRIKNVQEKLNCDVKDAINHIIAEEVANANVL
jgi:conjugal transfer ATP-binding protein TraC